MNEVLALQTALEADADRQEDTLAAGNFPSGLSIGCDDTTL